MEGTGAVLRWAQFVIDRRWIVLIGVTAITLAAGIWGSGVLNNLSQGGYNDPGSECVQVGELLKQDFGAQAPDVVVIYRAPADKSIDDIGDKVTAALSAIDSNLLARDSQTYWNSQVPQKNFLRSRDGKVALGLVYFKGNDSERIRTYNELVDRFGVPGVDTELSGFAPVAGEVNRIGRNDMKIAELISIPATLVLLLLIFGSLVGAVLPVAVGGLAIAGALAALRLISMVSEVSILAINTVTLLGLGLAIDYGLFIVSRFREELAAGRTPAEAVERTMVTAGRTVAFSGLLLVCAFSGLLVFPQAILKSLGFGAMSGVAIAAIGSLTVLPAALAIVGHRIDKFSWRKGAFERGQARAERFWGGVATRVMRRPVLIVGAIMIGFGLLLVPLQHVEFGDADQTVLPKDNQARETVEMLAQQFPNSASGAMMVVRGSEGRPPTQQEIALLTKEINSVDGVVDPLTMSLGAKGDYVVLHAALTSPDLSRQSVDTMKELKKIAVPPGVTVQFGGLTAQSMDGVASTLSWLPVMVAIMITATLILLLIAFRSVMLPVKAVAMAALSLGGTVGALTWIFHDGHLGFLLGVSPSLMPAGIVVLLIAIVFGLSTDYEVFLLSRMTEARAAGASTEDAVRIGIGKTGRVVTAAATLLIVVTGAFSLSSISMMRFIGVGMIIALVLDATVVRMLLVPALVKLMGDVNWWAPEFLAKRPVDFDTASVDVGAVQGDVRKETALV